MSDTTITLELTINHPVISPLFSHMRFHQSVFARRHETPGAGGKNGFGNIWNNGIDFYQPKIASCSLIQDIADTSNLHR